MYYITKLGFLRRSAFSNMVAECNEHPYVNHRARCSGVERQS